MRSRFFRDPAVPVNVELFVAAQVDAITIELVNNVDLSKERITGAERARNRNMV